jgi:hypothetical protein
MNCEIVAITGFSKTQKERARPNIKSHNRPWGPVLHITDD